MSADPSTLVSYRREEIESIKEGLAKAKDLIIEAACVGGVADAAVAFEALKEIHSAIVSLDDNRDTVSP